MMGRRARVRAFFALFVLALLWMGGGYALASGTIAAVRAEVAADGEALPPTVKVRMEKSVAAISAQLIEGKPLSSYEERRAADEATVREVFDKVLVGYSVTAVAIEPGEEAHVRVTLAPWAERVEAVEVEFSVDGVSPVIGKMAKEDLRGVETVFRQSLEGLPSAAVDWTNGVLKESLNAYMAEHLPEFRADFDVDTARRTHVALTVYPKMPVVRTIDLAMRSDTIANFALLEKRSVLQAKADEMLGVPVAFVARHEKEFARGMEEILDASGEFRTLGLKTHATIVAGEQTSVMSRSDTSRYRLRLEGWGDVGRRSADGNDITFRAHAGAMLSAADEIFVQADVLPQDFDWGWEAAYERRVFPGVFASIRYDMREHAWTTGVRAAPLPRVEVRWEYRRADHTGEAGLSYRLHDFLRAELVRDSSGGWLRLIGDF
ncbi:hypothetical protein [Selenomonas sputigena]|uniref:Uncharacterized protein n=1 Tax=Selenomonas sputigena (strain ATCC 35185 / DSM 20758 / CCUG 44933 / VPI D19B-28) TaxID=546271 RepID=C9LSC4_SELS3|nr:hypothetical protein [Selenomonas sputigena]AEC00757.1 hypothetical protein Selsp_1802 [Selenomonas sputigena ATCC 35185]EEX78164.1 hypothetical protein SELSPUOL_00348 [Selenomonas sputigena ATCC 35185]